MRKGRIFLVFAAGTSLVLVSIHAPVLAEGTKSEHRIAVPAPTPTPSTDSRPAADRHFDTVLECLIQNRQDLMSYHWVENTVVRASGQSSASQTSICRFDEKAHLRRTPLAPHGASADVYLAKSEQAESVKQPPLAPDARAALELMNAYMPPDPDRLQHCKEHGEMTMTVTEPGKQVRLDFKNYMKPGDRVAVMLNLATGRIANVTANTFFDKSTDAVTLNAQMATIKNRHTAYPAKISIDSPARQLSVMVTNSEYRKL
ncbi:MAG TPA: hypothetical protein VFH88_04665 [Candidatus Krumholzibacteria bacterium]|nr:hypothetical protein [Candidatus Krumholzibacteria bacterium]